MLFLMIVSLVSFSSCSSDDNNDNSNDGGDEFLRASVDGVNFVAAQDPAVIVGAQNTNGILAVQGGTNNGDTINFVIQGYSGIGTYLLADDISNSNLAQYLEINPAPTTWLSNGITALLGAINEGVIEITLDDGTSVEGTFSFEGYNGSDMTVKVVTNGEFKAKFD